MSVALSSGLMRNLGNGALYATGATALKSVGCIARILDNKGAPAEIVTQTKLREGITLSITWLSTLATQLTEPLFKNVLKLKSAGQVQLLRAGLVLAGYVLAEGLARTFSKATYADMAKHLNAKGSQAQTTLDRLTHWFASPFYANVGKTGINRQTAPLNPANFGRTHSAGPSLSPTFYSNRPYNNLFNHVAYHA